MKNKSKSYDWKWVIVAGSLVASAPLWADSIAATGGNPYSDSEGRLERHHNEDFNINQGDARDHRVKRKRMSRDEWMGQMPQEAVEQQEQRFRHKNKEQHQQDYMQMKRMARFKDEEKKKTHQMQMEHRDEWKESHLEMVENRKEKRETRRQERMERRQERKENRQEAREDRRDERREKRMAN